MNRVLPAIILFFLIFSPLSAQTDIRATIERSAQDAENYLALLEEYRGIFDHASELGIPREILNDTLAEGIVKGATPERISVVLREKTDRLADAVRLLPPAERFESASIYIQWLSLVETLFSTGLDGTAVSQLLSRDGASERTRHALFIVIDLIETVGMEPELAGTIGEALVSSRLPDSSFSQLVPVILRHRARGLLYSEISAKIVSVLHAGGGYVQIEAELSRRRR